MQGSVSRSFAKVLQFHFLNDLSIESIFFKFDIPSSKKFWNLKSKCYFIQPLKWETNFWRTVIFLGLFFNRYTRCLSMLKKDSAQISRQGWFKKTGQRELYINWYQNLLDSGTDCCRKDGKICPRNTVSPQTSKCLDDQQGSCTWRVILN